AIYKQLPKDKRLWQYNMSALAPLRPALDELVTSYIYHCHSEDFKALNTTLDEQQAFLKSAYGEGEKNLYEKYKKTKLSDLYIRMGNTVLQDMKKFSAISDQKKYARKFEKLRTHQRTNSTRGLSPINELRKALKKDFESIRNTNTYEQLMSEVHAGHLGEDMER
ncbi:MAG: relaxase MobL, partial [Oscillospiraceae bacterium]